ncbi:MAG: hypothetical protein CL811_06390 [Colwelliaceae bacterium]|jgi:hypothetical protein|nr:hypothetical protein [Colwelliaceae bacterium]|tara:strand:- start:257 stop:451 length:195 start_codon:yes stop_codon:yes gene_type:complete
MKKRYIILIIFAILLVMFYKSGIDLEPAFEMAYSKHCERYLDVERFCDPRYEERCENDFCYCDG